MDNIANASDGFFIILFYVYTSMSFMLASIFTSVFQFEPAPFYIIRFTAKLTAHGLTLPSSWHVSVELYGTLISVN